MQNLTHRFQELFEESGQIFTYFCPGRVNLIGEHIDYLGGQVLPMAISLGITALVRPTNDRTIRAHSADFSEILSFNLHQLPTKPMGNWGDFILGVIIHLQDQKISVKGFDILLSSTLPKGSGLSSSAALEVLIYYLLYHQTMGKEPDRTQMALDCQKIENEFIGVNCGIMDQFAVSTGKENEAILLNCNTLERTMVPLNPENHSLLIINSNKPRALAESAYNQRIKECSEALKIISGSRRIENLVQATESDLQLMTDPILRKRTRHAFSEQHRVLASELVLQNNDLDSFGKLMTASHASLRDDYEVSCQELDFIVDALLAEPTCLGARLTGAGFGGCCIALLEKNDLDATKNRLSSAYSTEFGYELEVYDCQPSDGVHQVAL